MTRVDSTLAARRIVAAALLGAPVVLPAQRPLTVELGMSIRPDTVTVGEPFVVQIAVRVPRPATVEFPADPDSTRPVQSLAPQSLGEGPRTDADFVEYQATYRVAAWDVGALDVVHGEILVQRGAEQRRVNVPRRQVFVRSVLPEDSTQRVPKPARELLVQPYIPWWWWAVLAAALLLAWLLWRWWTRRGRTVAGREVDPLQWAFAQFARIESLRLIEAGERGRYAALMVDVFRGYLARRYPAVPLSMTSAELLAAMRNDAGVPTDRLLRLLNEIDLVKFARRALGDYQARALGAEARALVERDHEWLMAQRVAADRARRDAHERARKAA